MSIIDNEETVDKFLVYSYSDLLSSFFNRLTKRLDNFVSDNEPLFLLK